MALRTSHGGSSPSQGSPLPSVGWLHLGESHFSWFIQRELAMEVFEPPTLTLKSALLCAPLPFSQTSQDAPEDLFSFVCLLWTSSSLSTEPRGQFSKAGHPLPGLGNCTSQ